MTFQKAAEALEQVGVLVCIDGNFVLSDYGRQIVEMKFGEIPEDTESIYQFLFEDHGLEVDHGSPE